MRLSEIVPWIELQIGPDNAGGRLLVTLWINSPEIGAVVAEFSWVQDGVTTAQEQDTLGILNRLQFTQPELGRIVANFPWLAAELSSVEWTIIQSLARTAFDDEEFASRVMGLQWLAQAPLSQYAWLALNNLLSIYREDEDLAWLLTRTPWLTDDLTRNEVQGVLDSLSRMVREGHIELANHLARSSWLSGNQISDLHANALISLQRRATFAPDTLEDLLAEPWFQDGLDEYEAIDVLAMDGP